MRRVFLCAGLTLRSVFIGADAGFDDPVERKLATASGATMASAIVLVRRICRRLGENYQDQSCFGFAGGTTRPESSGLDMRYATRNHAFVPATTWELSKNMLQWEEENRPPQALAVTEIRQVRLEFAPTRPEPNRFRCRLVLRNGTTKDFYNRTYRGLYDFFDTSAEYVKFVEALHATLVVHAPGCEFVAGVAKANYVFSWVSTVFGGICILIAAQYLVLNGLALLLFLKIALLAYFGPNVYRWFVRNKPRTYNPVAIPVNVLPKKDSSWFTEPP